MELNLNKITEKLSQNEFVKNFIQELGKTLENANNQNNNVQLTDKEELEFEKREFDFLQEYFKKELSDLSRGEVFIVTNKYDNDELHRYKVTQYKNNLECKYIAFEKDLPQNVQLRDVVRKVNGSYIYDEQVTQYLKNAINDIKQEIVNNREK